MSSRYERVFTLDNNLYQKGSPVVVSAGALLKDNKNNKIVAQLKIKNISRNPIKAAKVLLHTFDTVGNPVDSDTTYEYLDLQIARDGEFGQQVAIPIKDNTTRSFTLEVVSVAFEDNTLWKSRSKKWQSLPEQAPISDMIKEDSLVEQYVKKTSPKSRNAPLEYENLWLCACGSINHDEEQFCHECKCSKESIFNTEIEELREMHIQQIKAEEEARKRAEEEAKKARIEAELKTKELKKKARRILMRVLIVAIVIIITGVTLSKVIIPKVRLDKALDLIETENYNEAYDILEKLGENDLINQSIYYRAESLAENGDFNKAILLYEQLGEYEDSAKRIENCKMSIKENDYNAALALLNDEQYEKAFSAFEALEDYKDSDTQREKCLTTIKENKYSQAIGFIEQENYEDAYNLLKGLDYKDSEDVKESIRLIYFEKLLSNAQVGSTVLLGTYEQDNDKTNGKEDIEWQVLEKQGNKMLLISKYGLDERKYDDRALEIIHWENCELRTWLNSTFLQSAFNSKEKAMIKETEISNQMLRQSGKYTDSFDLPSTTDQIFLLSVDEIEKYFPTKEQKVCSPTEYAIAQGADSNWWLRTPFRSKIDANEAKFVLNNFVSDSLVHYAKCVRPAMWIEIG